MRPWLAQRRKGERKISIAKNVMLREEVYVQKEPFGMKSSIKSRLTDPRICLFHVECSRNGSHSFGGSQSSINWFGLAQIVFQIR